MVGAGTGYELGVDRIELPSGLNTLTTSGATQRLNQLDPVPL
jgi:hypothetical protein